jgi:hypothetical protein
MFVPPRNSDNIGMTITYPTGAVREAVLLAEEDDVLKVATPTGEVRTFTCRRGVWLSEACEPVTLGFHTAIGV